MKHLAIVSFLLWLPISSSNAQMAPKFRPPKFVCTSEKPKTDGDFNEWSRNVRWIMSSTEEERFSGLKSYKAREKFIGVFWDRRDPDQATKRNEFREEYCERVKRANAFESGIPGWKTDRGRTYLLFGKPNSIESGRADLEDLKSIPFEVWRYKHIACVGDNIKITFVDPTESQEYRISTNDSKLMMKLFENSRLGLSICLGSLDKNVRTELWLQTQ